MPDSKMISLVKTDVDYQKTQTAAYNYEGYRAKPATAWSPATPREPSDNNLRFFNTKFKRINFRVDSQPNDLGIGSHTFSFKTSISERRFDILHQDSVYIDNDYDGVKEWVDSKDSTMMYPVKTRHYSLSLLDNIEFSPEWKAHLGIRYDRAKHSQESLGGLACRNCQKADDAKFHNFSWTAGVEKILNDDWKLGYSIGTGYRMPNASEMYFDYRNNAAGAWKSNPSLKAEKSLTQNLNLLGKGRLGEMSLNLHHSSYKDFLYEQETWENYNYYGNMLRWRPVQQMQNIDSAKIYGVEFTGKLNLNEVTPIPNGWKLFGSLGYSKGSMSNGASLMSIQPVKAIIGLDYEHPEGKWGIFSRFTYLGATKAKNAKYLKTVERCVKEERVRNPYYDYGYGEEFEIKCTEEAHETALDTWKHLNSKAFVFDMFGFYKPTENITLRAGVYNLFNRRYHTWDTLRGLNNTGGKINSVGLKPNYRYGGYPGLERFYQPGRNFAASIEIRF